MEQQQAQLAIAMYRKEQGALGFDRPIEDHVITTESTDADEDNCLQRWRLLLSDPKKLAYFSCILFFGISATIFSCLAIGTSYWSTQKGLPEMVILSGIVNSTDRYTGITNMGLWRFCAAAIGNFTKAGCGTISGSCSGIICDEGDDSSCNSFSLPNVGKCSGLDTSRTLFLLSLCCVSLPPMTFATVTWLRFRTSNISRGLGGISLLGSITGMVGLVLFYAEVLRKGNDDLESTGFETFDLDYSFIMMILAVVFSAVCAVFLEIVARSDYDSRGKVPAKHTGIAGTVNMVVIHPKEDSVYYFDTGNGQIRALSYD